MALISTLHLVSGDFVSYDNGGSHSFGTDQLTCNSATVSTRGGVESASSYQIRGDSLYIKVDYPASGDIRIALEVVDSNDTGYMWWVEGNLIYKRKTTGTETDIGFNGYSDTNETWWKISESSNIVSFQTATDSGGVPGTFTERDNEDWSTNNSTWNPDAVKLRLYGYQYITDNNSMNFYLLNGAAGGGGASPAQIDGAGYY